MIFKNREEAGKLLAEQLSEYEDTPNVLVLGVPNGGLALAHTIAVELELPLSVVITKKIGFPTNPEAAIGAVRPDGKHTIDSSWIDYQGITLQYITEQQREVAAIITKKYKDLTGKIKQPSVKGKKIILVDDGVATGHTFKAAAMFLKEQEPQRLVIALPFIMADILDEMKDIFDSAIVLHKPLFMNSVHEFYEDFSKVTDAEVKKMLKERKKK